MRNIISRSITTTGSYAALNATKLIVSGTLTGYIEEASAGDPAFRLRNELGADVKVPVNVPFHLDRVDLSTIRVKTGTDAAVVTFVGHTV